MFLRWFPLFTLGFIFFIGCSQDIPRAAKESLPGNLLDEAKARGIQGPSRSDQKIFLYAFSRAGIRRDTLVLLPGAVWEMSAQVYSPSTQAGLWVGMPFQLGDGAELTVQALNKKQATEIARLYLDPAHSRRDQQWRRLWFAIPTGTDRIRLRVTAGPKGDGTADWMGLAPESP